MPVVLNRRVQSGPQQGRDLQRTQPRCRRLLDQPANRLTIQRLHRLRREAGYAVPRLPGPARCHQPATGGPRHIELLQPPRNDPGREKIGLQKSCERRADPVLVARNDRGMRDRQAERMPEQRRHRKPVGQPADHRGFGKGPHIAKPRIGIAPGARRQKDAGHHDEHARRDDLHATRRVGRQIERWKPHPVITSFGRLWCRSGPVRLRSHVLAELGRKPLFEIVGEAEAGGNNQQG